MARARQCMGAPAPPRPALREATARTPPTAPSPAPRGGAASGPAPPAGSGLHRASAGAEQARPPPPGDCARGTPGARASGLPPQFPLARPGEKVEDGGWGPGKVWAPPRGCLPGSLRPCTPALVGWEGEPGFSHTRWPYLSGPRRPAAERGGETWEAPPSRHPQRPTLLGALGTSKQHGLPPPPHLVRAVGLQMALVIKRQPPCC